MTLRVLLMCLFLISIIVVSSVVFIGTLALLDTFAGVHYTHTVEYLLGLLQTL